MTEFIELRPGVTNQSLGFRRDLQISNGPK